jgi:peptidyl-prolyl cis-trans isomerase A (cyclophilin A)
MGIRVRISTPLGDISCLLFPDRAPLSAGSFLAHVDAGLYDGTSFYRASRPDNEIWPAMPAILLQGGLGFHGGSPLPLVAHEPSSMTGLLPTLGTLALARNEPGTACSEFFINLADNSTLAPGGGRGDDLGVAVFGVLEGGLDVARAILAGPVGTIDALYPEIVRPQVLNPPAPILSIRRT